MPINTTTLETNLTTKINATSGSTDAKEFLLLGKAVESLSNSTAIGSADIDFGTYKITYSNNYAQLSDLPNASTYHGMFAHVHATGKGYYSHAGAWLPLVNEDSSGNVTIGGNLVVSGTTTTVNSTTLDVADKNITVAKGAADAAAANGAGISVDGASATLTYASATDNWNFNKGLAVNGALNIEEVKEKVIVDTTTSGNIQGELSLGAVRYYTANQTANRTIYFKGSLSGSVTLDSIMAVGDSMTSAFLFTQGSTPYYVAAFNIDGGAPAVTKWVGGAPTGGNASGIDAYTFTIIKTASATFTVIANLTAYA
jgi:hypothetical protein